MIEILEGDVRAVLPTLADDSFDCAVTSPPYFGLRDYGCAGQIGLEPSLEEYLAEMVAICREVRRVLKPCGTFWLNIGDSYAGSWGARGRGNSTNAARPDLEAKHGTAAPNRNGCAALGIKPKDLCMVPARLALALQADGWWIRSEIIWHKPNPMPESVTDRPTSAHEKVWLLTKSDRYFYDAAAIRESFADARMGKDGSKKSSERNRGGRSDGFTTPANIDPSANGGKNARNVWTITPKPFKEAHFATFPPELAERCIKAGCPAGGTVLDPFGGAGTTGLVAQRLGRSATLIELNSAYAAMARRRIDAELPDFMGFCAPAAAPDFLSL